MRVLHFRHPNTRSPAPTKKQKLSSPQQEVDLTCYEKLALKRELTDWIPSDSDFLHVLQEREGAQLDGRKALERHGELSIAARAVLVDWMMSVCAEFGMRRETLYASVHLVDTYLHMSPTPLPKRSFQLLGLSSLYISSKFEEASAPPIQSMLWSSGFTYTSTDLLDMEREILRITGWRLVLCTEETWAKWAVKEWERYWKDKGGMYTSSFLVFYTHFTQLLDTSLLSPPSPSLPISLLVAGAFHLSLGKGFNAFIQNSDFWPFARAVFGIETNQQLTKVEAFLSNYSDFLPVVWTGKEQEGKIDLLDGFQRHNSENLPLFQRLFID